MTIRILATLGPSSFAPHVLYQLERAGVSLFRINLSHTEISDLDPLLKQLSQATRVPICIDTEGAQIRTPKFTGGTIELTHHQLVHIHFDSAPNHATDLSFYPTGVARLLEEGDLISIDFNQVILQVIHKQSSFITARVVNGGIIGSNKGIAIDRDISLPALTEKDSLALEIAAHHCITNYALSFCQSAEDAIQFHALVGSDAFVIAKIESRRGLIHLHEIAQIADALLIDRGDLSREVPIQQIPAAQKHIIQVAKQHQKPVFVATNLLESMTQSPMPTRAEVNDIYSTLCDGASGLVLASETAIGRFPVACANMVATLIQQFESSKEFTAPSKSIHSHEKYPSIILPQIYLNDCELIASGVCAPLHGFLDSTNLLSVAQHQKMKNGAFWPIPIALMLPKQQLRAITKGITVQLQDQTKTTRYLLHVSQVFSLSDCDLDSNIASSLIAHAQAAMDVSNTEFACLAGAVVSFQNPVRIHGGFTPTQMRSILECKAWTRILGIPNDPSMHEQVTKKSTQFQDFDGCIFSSMDPSFFDHIPASKAICARFASLSFLQFDRTHQSTYSAIFYRNLGATHCLFPTSNQSPNILNALKQSGIELIFTE